MKALVVMPAFNEEASLASTLKELASGVPYVDIVVVDDGSTDATAAIARRGNAAVLRLPFNLGVGGGLTQASDGMILKSIVGRTF